MKNIFCFLAILFQSGCASDSKVAVPSSQIRSVDNEFGQFQINSPYAWQNRMPSVGSDAPLSRPAIAKINLSVSSVAKNTHITYQSYILPESAKPIPVEFKSEAKLWNGIVEKGSSYDIELVARNIILPKSSRSIKIAMHVSIEKHEPFWLITPEIPVEVVY